MGILAILLGVAFVATGFTENRKDRWHRYLALFFFVLGTFLMLSGVLTIIAVYAG